MSHVTILPANSIGRSFLSEKFIPNGKDEYYLRDTQFEKKNYKWRQLHTYEVEQLIQNRNTADNWDDILVTDQFNTSLIQNCTFYGRVQIGILREVVLEQHDLRLPAGFTNSTIISCDIGDDVAIHEVRYLAHYIIGDRCILANIDEMHTTNHAKFGNGIIKEGEEEDVRIWLDLMNETGSRAVMPFDGMIPADAYLWAKFRDDKKLVERLGKLTQDTFDARRGFYGTVGSECVIKNSRILKDVKIGSSAYIKGSNKLKNLTINSSDTERTQIGEGVEMVNGIVGYGAQIFYGCKAVRFILGNNTKLKYGARLIHSFLGDNSTISCCEVLNNLIFPAHEQHHNNSFLIASVILGQSNLAAGATIGSNHNSRANDNEIQAGRGFWPGLCVSLKHSCRFASFVLLAKGDYPAELDIPFPFSMLNNNVACNRLEVMPAYWWLYNMYALARNSWKFQDRDIRITKEQQIEYDALAPDTVEEIVRARSLLEIWTAKAQLRKDKQEINKTDRELREIGEQLLNGPKETVDGLEVVGEGMERTDRQVRILKVYEAYRAYGEMMHYYAVKNLMEYLETNDDASLETMRTSLDGARKTEWINLGGQLSLMADVDALRSDIGNGKLNSWDEIHRRYQILWNAYPGEKQRHAYAILCLLLNEEELSEESWHNALARAAEIQEMIRERVYHSRSKDFENSFRKATYRNREEMTAAIGTIEDNSFVRQIGEETRRFKEKIVKLKGV